ncbi:MAG: hypothetical protein A2233_04190 [Candidatus Kerfeldbacteria bacterium RIFOXYA2_FULL_38_24]|uniref:Polymerase beta nucleotidyltransferase domain-containing protein n=1 Tax=Candidatus Kerfeldbacteria bacterium RIFOXYB2_FULL_38_14 TaxID=1798547 RepID=A0A1G2BF73_9BACT|nr:MAG: hypothetical protein A2233_04190 [Candidatus Kerfeldbacteria bacterium RIFOXYA2_FULL_38_24]OGY86920.1 MAG: hypothetical protein A2319_00040 [Candidatus Kerfeldbacteria bacterium RIFOXYB2_FULL_38_14]
MEIKLSNSAKKQLQQLGVSALYLFGSRAQNIATPQSDYDFAVLFDPSIIQQDKIELYNKIYDILSPLCPRTLKNDVIDIVFLDQAGLEMKTHVIRYGQVLFDIKPKQRLAFEEKTSLAYADFKPLLNIFDKAILAAI